jgi:hypothetical protein
MILKKVALPLGVDGKSYWEAMIGGITNNKLCLLRANVKQELFEQFKGKFYSMKTWKWFCDTNEIMFYVFHINTDDKENEWFPPSDNNGKIYVNARGWTSDPQDSKPTYDQPELFLQFLDKYGSHAVGNHNFLQLSKSNRSKTFLDKVMASDIACTILVYENTTEVWEEDLQIKASSRTDEERRNAMHHKKPSIMKGGESISKLIAMTGQTVEKSITKNCSGSLRNSSQVMYGIHFKVIGNCIKRSIMPEMIIKLKN